MTLEIAVLDLDYRLMRSVQLGVDAHWDIIGAARKLSLPLWERFYFGEAEIFIVELPVFLEEIEALSASSSLSAEAQDHLKRLAELTRFAMEQTRTLVAIPD